MSNVRPRPTPTNQEKKFTIDEMFFSTTDRRGVILAGNETFTRISGYSKEEMIGSPHNIIRHPDMPKVVFKLLWSQIQDKKPIVAYVKNMAIDGCYYWVLATVFPAKEKYISIRIKPSSPYFQLVQEVYKQMLEVEKTGGMEASGKLLFEILNSKNFTSYDAFMIAVLTEELKCKDKALEQSNELSTALMGLKVSSDAENLLEYFQGLCSTSRILGDCFGKIFSKLDNFISLNAILQEKSQFMLSLSREIRILSLNAAVESARIDGAGASLSVLAKEMGSYSKTSENEINKINNDINSVASELEKVIFNVGAAKLQINMVTFFATELLNRLAASDVPMGDGMTEIKRNSADLLETLEPFAKEATSLISAVKKGLSDLTNKLEQLDTMVRTLELIHVNGMIEAARVGEDGKGFVSLFNQMLKSVEKAKGELKQFRRSIAQIMDEADLIIKMEQIIFDSINKINLSIH